MRRFFGLSAEQSASARFSHAHACCSVLLAAVLLAGPARAELIGLAGIAAWDALPVGEKAKIKTTIQSFFLHQSVGGDLEDGAEAGGYKFEYAASGASSLANGLNGGLFVSSNGNASGKISEFRSMALANKSTLRVAIMKFGYADIVSGTVAAAQTNYLAAVTAIKAEGVRVLHITPPLVYGVPSENAPKMQLRAWMSSTFPGDVIFDLEDIESTDADSGARCQRGGSWEICDSIRSTAACPSLNQGVDAPTGQGHLCFEPHAKRMAKGFLYAIYRAGSASANVPGAPAISSAEPGAGSARLHFTAPDDAGDSPISAYLATCTAGGQASRTASANASPITVKGLRGGTRYACVVAASNSAGTGAASPSVQLTPLTARNSVGPALLLLD